MRRSLFIRILPVVMAVAVGACAPRYNVSSNAKFATGFDPGLPAEPVAVGAGLSSRSVQLKSLGISRIPNGQAIGGAGVGSNCTLAVEEKFGNKNVIEEPSIVYKRAFYDTLKENNYNVMGNPDAMFEDKSQLRPDYLVGVTLTEFKKNECYVGSVVNANAARSTEMEIGLEWQFYDAQTNSVALSVRTKGYYKGDSASDPLGSETFKQVITNNVKMLVANQKVHDLLVNGSSNFGNPAPAVHNIRLKAVEKLHGSIQTNMDRVQDAVVMISFPTGHGSGVVISDDGYILSCKHVVGNARVVKIKTSHGKELEAEVVAVDGRQDVALLKAVEPIADGLPIAGNRTSVGAEVYAIGTPLSKSYANTVTKGIVSGYRTNDGVSQIQSDVSIEPGNSGGPLLDASGNILGVSRSMVGLAGLPIRTGISFFTPIDEAVKALNVSFERL